MSGVTSYRLKPGLKNDAFNLKICWLSALIVSSSMFFPLGQAATVDLHTEHPNCQVQGMEKELNHKLIRSFVN